MEMIEIGKIIGLCLFAYLVGSIPFGYIVSWLKGIDIRKVGSGKTGATNIGRALGWRYKIGVATADAWKGAVAVLVTHYITGWSLWTAAALALPFCLLGAILSFWLKLFTKNFRAGAGVSALIGGILILFGLKVWLIIMACWLIILIFFVRRRMSVASLSLTGIVLISIAAMPLFGATPHFSWYLLPPYFIALGLIWWAHRENLQRIRDGKEPSTRLPLFLNKLPGDLVSWSIEKLQLLLQKLQAFQKKQS